MNKDTIFGLKDHLFGKKSYLYMAIIFLICLFLIILINNTSNVKDGDMLGKKGDCINEDTEEKRLESILSEIEGVGECHVLMAKNDSSVSDSNYIFSKESALAQNRGGVIIVCEGGDNEELKIKIRNAVSSALSIPMYKVEILKKTGGV